MTLFLFSLWHNIAFYPYSIISQLCINKRSKHKPFVAFFVHHSTILVIGITPELICCKPTAVCGQVGATISYAFLFYYTQLTSIFPLSFIPQETISRVSTKYLLRLYLCVGSASRSFSRITVVTSDPCGPHRHRPKKRCPNSRRQIAHPSQGPQEDPVL